MKGLTQASVAAVSTLLKVMVDACTPRRRLRLRTSRPAWRNWSGLLRQLRLEELNDEHRVRAPARQHGACSKVWRPGSCSPRLEAGVLPAYDRDDFSHLAFQDCVPVNRVLLQPITRICGRSSALRKPLHHMLDTGAAPRAARPAPRRTPGERPSLQPQSAIRSLRRTSRHPIPALQGFSEIRRSQRFRRDPPTSSAN